MVILQRIQFQMFIILINIQINYKFHTFITISMQVTPNLFNHKSEIDQALFFAISREDFETAYKLVEANANPNSIFQLDKGVFLSSFSLFINKTAAIGSSKGPNNAQYISCMKLIKLMTKKASLECKCLKEHKCPLYIALQAFKINDEEQVLSCKCDLVRCLIMNGATLKFEQKQDQKSSKAIGKWSLKWLDLEGIKNYLITKNCNYVETKIDK